MKIYLKSKRRKQMQLKDELSSKNTLQLRLLQINTIKERAKRKKEYLISYTLVLFALILTIKH
jgi:hypothetical protein